MSYALIAKAVEPSKLSAKTRALLGGALAADQCVLEPKYDGCNAVLDIIDHRGSGDNFRSIGMQSRTGEQVRSTQHIARAAASAVLLPGRYFGEVWHPSWPFRKISGAFRRHEDAPELVFMLFDYIDAGEVAAGGSTLPLNLRRERLLDLAGGLRGPIQVADRFPLPAGCTLDELLERTPAMLQALRGRGGAYDGLMLKQLHLGLKLGSSGSDGACVKLKPRASADLLCVGTYPGEGKYEGMMGGIIVSLDGTPTGPTCKVGTGFDDKDRTRCIVSDPWQGKTVEVTYLELTEANKLREPAFIAVRFDKNQPDNLLEE